MTTQRTVVADGTTEALDWLELNCPEEIYHEAMNFIAGAVDDLNSKKMSRWSVSISVYSDLIAMKDGESFSGYRVDMLALPPVKDYSHITDAEADRAIEKMQQYQFALHADPSGNVDGFITVTLAH